MSWWEDAWNFATDVGGQAVDFAKANPELTGAVVGGLANGTKGALTGAAVGYGLSNLAPDTFGGGTYSLPRFNEGTWSQTPTAASVGGAPSSFTSIGSSPSSPYAASMSTGLQSGSYSPVVDIAASNGMSVAPSSSYGNTGVSGDFGNYLTSGPNKLESMLGDLKDWGKKNPNTSSLLVQGAGLLLGNQQQRRANDLAEQNLALQRDYNNFNRQQVEQNNANADYWNTQAQQSASEARSLYNPQELGIRGMAQQKAQTARAVDELDQLYDKGWSAADVAAEKRRAGLAGSANATTGYMQGLDLGRQAQSGALSSAKQLSSSYGSLPAIQTYDADGASKQGELTTSNLTSLLERYLGDPTKEQRKTSAKKEGVLQ